MMNRRSFLQAAAAAGAVLVWPRRALPFAQSVKPILKFAVPLPGLGPTGIPVLTPTEETINGVATDVYTIAAEPFTQNLLGAAAPNINHATKLWGYADGDNPSSARYLGGVIVATSGKPVQVRITNNLPQFHILPNDITLVDPASGEAGFAGRGDRLAVHLHGGFVFWDSDGGPFLWFSNANPANGGFISGSSFINGDPMNPGTAIYNYPNQQSARMLWYHDHAYGLTRTNVYAGLVSAYLITDAQETALINSGAVPAPSLGGVSYPVGVPLILQDKTFWDQNTDPTYANPGVVPAGTPAPGDLWYPHVYEGAADPDGLPSMTYTDLPANPPNPARWGQTPFPPPMPAPTPSIVPEFFSDTILINGAPYPTVTVPPTRFRFRILNGSQSRFYNLQLYVADSTPDGITLANTGEVDPNANPTLAPVNRPGPAFIQIGNEAGFIPAPVVFGLDPTGNLNFNSNRIMGFKLNSTELSSRHRADSGAEVQVGGELIKVAEAGDPTIGNANRFNLLLATAERADIIVDFRGFTGQTLILYNDSPAPFPGGDIRNDYYVGAPDLTSIGGVPTPQAGQGPDTRIMMRFVVAGSETAGEPTLAQTVSMLQSELPAAFAASQPSLDLTPTTTKIKSLLEDNDAEFGRLRQLLSDESATAITFLDTPTDTATVGEVQEWQIYNTTADTHPIHFHLVNVKVISRQQWAFNSDGSPVMPLQPLAGSPVLPPDPNENGWKEVVRMNPGEITTVQMQFSLPTGTQPENSPRLSSMYGINGAEYVWHCHILEHEEHDMMHALVVMPAPTASPTATSKAKASAKVPGSPGKKP